MLKLIYNEKKTYFEMPLDLIIFAKTENLRKQTMRKQASLYIAECNMYWCNSYEQKFGNNYQNYRNFDTTI